MQVGSLVGDEVVTVAPDASVREVAESLTANEVGVVAVGLQDRPIAVVSERDIARAVAQSRDPDGTTAIDIAHRELVWCDASAPIRDVAAEMMDRYVRHVLVEENGALVGVVSARDLLGYYTASDDGDQE
jgi:CBS domain-containing protein